MSTSDNNLLMRKLPDPELLQFVQEDTDQKFSIIIEPDLPPQEIFFSKHRTDRFTSAYLPKGVVEEKPAQQKKNEHTIKKTREYLESLLGTTPRWLNSARAFVVSVTPAQLREITQSSLTKRVRINRTLST
jgi:hypothetical protein